MKKHRADLRKTFKAAIVLAALLVFAASCLQQNTNKTDLTITATNTAVPMTAREISGSDHSVFSHSVPEHNEINCDACHQRAGDSLNLKYSGHDSCIGCHLNEFTAPGQPVQGVQSGQSGQGAKNICMICHDNIQTVPATMRPFPAHFNESFNMRFDHAAHSQGEGLPQAGCNACHTVAGAAQTIPVGVVAHTTCFNCHTPESDIGSCSVCHTLSPYRRTPAASTIFKANFRHSDHTPRQGVNCADCHTVKAGAPQSEQVSGPVALQHFPAGAAVSCRTCHNDRRAFGEKDFANCKRCHTGAGFDMLP